LPHVHPRPPTPGPGAPGHPSVSDPPTPCRTVTLRPLGHGGDFGQGLSDRRELPLPLRRSPLGGVGGQRLERGPELAHSLPDAHELPPSVQLPHEGETLRSPRGPDVEEQENPLEVAHHSFECNNMWEKND
jgi:hypothetical protein